jgi:hypothetical protein
MKKYLFFRICIVAILIFSTGALMAQDMKTFTWDSYKTKFSVPSDFRITSSTGDKWSGTNDDITLSIFPRTGENLSHTGMQDAVYNWAVSSGVKEIGDVTELDEQKINGYWGYMYEGTLDGFPVATMLIVDPDYPDISLYIWISYRSGLENTVIDMLTSFTPSEVAANSMKDFTWDTYKTKFSVPSDFRVTSSTGDKWSGTNDDITLSIYPRTGENLSHEGMKDAVYNWAVSSNVKDIGTVTELDEQKLNGYWGYMYEGELDGFPVATMLIVDPDYPNIGLYIWISYRTGLEDTAIDMLMSFTPN